VYRTADDRYVSIGALEDHFWSRMTTALGLDELGGARYASWQQRREHIAELEEPLRNRVASFERDELIELLVKVDVPVAPVNDLHEAAADPHARARGMVYDVPGADWSRVAEWPVALDG
jgi:crotonobetainyl-CoA:carnitine CoA-transferase CaiB-like acyl-CoA transferase